MKIGFVGSRSARTLAYLNLLYKYKFELDFVIMYNHTDVTRDLDVDHLFRNFRNEMELSDVDKAFYFDSHSVYDLAGYVAKNVFFLDEASINTSKVQDLLTSNKADFCIFSGKPGEIVSADILDCAKLVHIHPGSLPSYRGSTVYFYEYLDKQHFTSTAIFLMPAIDTGEVLIESKMSLSFLPKLTYFEIDYALDIVVRLITLKKVMHMSATDKTLIGSKQSQDVNNYYIIHPVIKRIAIDCMFGAD